PILSPAEITALRDEIRAVRVGDAVRRYAVEIVRGTRRVDGVDLGASPRAALALYRAAQAHAAIRGRAYVLPDDVKAQAVAVLRHRLFLNADAQMRGRTTSANIAEILILRGHRRSGEDLGDAPARCSAAQLGIGSQAEAVTEHRARLRLHVVGQDIRAPANRRMRLRGAIQRERGPRARAEIHAVDASRAADDLDGVAADGVADAHGADLVPQRRDLGRREDRSQGVRPEVRRSVDPQNRVFVVGVGVAEVQEEEESVELRLRQWERALKLDRVLRRD